MNDHPELIVMLTHNDLTVENAAEVFETCKNSKAEYWGFKETVIAVVAFVVAAALFVTAFAVNRFAVKKAEQYLLRHE